MFEALGNTEKTSECQNYIDQCDQFEAERKLKSEAQSSFNKGVGLFEQQQYEEAKSAFEEALAKYTDLGDEEKIRECEEWITSCEEAMTGEPEEEEEEPEDDGGLCIGSSLIVLIFLSGTLINVLSRKNRSKK